MEFLKELTSGQVGFIVLLMAVVAWISAVAGWLLRQRKPAQTQSLIEKEVERIRRGKSKKNDTAGRRAFEVPPPFISLMPRQGEWWLYSGCDKHPYCGCSDLNTEDIVMYEKALFQVRHTYDSEDALNAIFCGCLKPFLTRSKT